MFVCSFLQFPTDIENKSFRSYSFDKFDKNKPAMNFLVRVFLTSKINVRLIEKSDRCANSSMKEKQRTKPSHLTFDNFIRTRQRISRREIRFSLVNQAKRKSIQINSIEMKDKENLIELLHRSNIVNVKINAIISFHSRLSSILKRWLNQQWKNFLFCCFSRCWIV